MATRVHLTYAGDLGEDRADALLTALQARGARLGPVIGEDTGARTFTVTLAVDVDDRELALRCTRDLVSRVLIDVDVDAPELAASVDMVSAA
jgi:hypothetical protein